MKTITIEVTQEDIEKGERKEACACPIARAIERTINGAEVSVAPKWATISMPQKGTIDADLPTEAKAFICKFDDGEPVQPFTFQLEVPE